MQAREFLNYRLKYCWLKVFCCICQVVNQTNLNGKFKKKLGGAKQKPEGAMVHPGFPLESPLLSLQMNYNKSFLKCLFGSVPTPGKD